MAENLSSEEWQQIKALASRLQATLNLLKGFEEQDSETKLSNELEPMQEQLIADFNVTMNTLIEIIEKFDL
ncbi:MAG TPA: hypothetical protein V6D15_12970 [Oculatellaceae cyanobacterium]|jgi:hypothetical protein